MEFYSQNSNYALKVSLQTGKIMGKKKKKKSHTQQLTSYNGLKENQTGKLFEASFEKTNNFFFRYLQGESKQEYYVSKAIMSRISASMDFGEKGHEILQDIVCAQTNLNI